MGVAPQYGQMTQSTTQQQVVISNRVIVSQSGKVLTCGDVFCKCQAPQFRTGQLPCGVVEILCPGEAACWGSICGCYGHDRPDCCAVCLAGFCQGATTEFCIGWISSCIVGFKMVGAC